MKNIYYLIFLVCMCSNAQESRVAHKIEYYKNGYFEAADELRFQVVDNSDTINCRVIGGKLVLPVLTSNCSLVVTEGNRKFTIRGIDFKNIEETDEIIFGVERRLKNFRPIETNSKDVTQYLLKDRLAFVKIDNLEKAKEVCFIIFQSPFPAGQKPEKTIVKSYSRFAVVKPR